MSGDESRSLDDAVIAYLEAVEAGRAPDRADYPELAEFFADEDAVRRWTAPLRKAAEAGATVTGDPAQTVDLPARVAEVLEIAKAGLRRRHEQDVVGVVSREEAGAPARPAVRRRAAADTGLDSSRDHLIERWIAGHRIWQLARQVRIGASELDGRRRAAALAVAGIDIERS